MYHEKARQRIYDQRWFYTVTDRNGTGPIGYCAEGCTGHSLAEGAIEHQKQWLIDHAHVIPDDKKSKDQHKCEAKDCENFTSGGMSLTGGQFFHLCDKHRTKDVLNTLVTVGESFGS